MPTPFSQPLDSQQDHWWSASDDFVFDGVSLKLGNQPILRDLNLSFRRRETVAIIGESGCGKTTLLKLMIGLLEPTQGHVLFRGKNLVGMSPREQNNLRRHIGFLFQASALFDSLSVYDNVAFGLRTQGILAEKEIEPIVREKLEDVGLSPEVGNKFPSELSGGMRKRVGLARALALNPEFLLYDEPTTGLDPVMTDVINELILKVGKDLGITGLIVTHEMRTVRKVADRVIMLAPLDSLEPGESQILFDGSVAELQIIEDPRIKAFIQGDSHTVRSQGGKLGSRRQSSTMIKALPLPGQEPSEPKETSLRWIDPEKLSPPAQPEPPRFVPLFDQKKAESIKVPPLPERPPAPPAVISSSPVVLGSVVATPNPADAALWGGSFPTSPSTWEALTQTISPGKPLAPPTAQPEPPAQEPTPPPSPGTMPSGQGFSTTGLALGLLGGAAVGAAAAAGSTITPPLLTPGLGLDFPPTESKAAIPLEPQPVLGISGLPADSSPAPAEAPIPALTEPEPSLPQEPPAPEPSGLDAAAPQAVTMEPLETEALAPENPIEDTLPQEAVSLDPSASLAIPPQEPAEPVSPMGLEEVLAPASEPIAMETLPTSVGENPVGEAASLIAAGSLPDDLLPEVGAAEPFPAAQPNPLEESAESQPLVDLVPGTQEEPAEESWPTETPLPPSGEAGALPPEESGESVLEVSPEPSAFSPVDEVEPPVTAEVSPTLPVLDAGEILAQAPSGDGEPFPVEAPPSKPIVEEIAPETPVIPPAQDDDASAIEREPQEPDPTPSWPLEESVEIPAEPIPGPDIEDPSTPESPELRNEPAPRTAEEAPPPENEELEPALESPPASVDLPPSEVPSPSVAEPILPTAAEEPFEQDPEVPEPFAAEESHAAATVGTLESEARLGETPEFTDQEEPPGASDLNQEDELDAPPVEPLSNEEEVRPPASQVPWPTQDEDRQERAASALSKNPSQWDSTSRETEEVDEQSQGSQANPAEDLPLPAWETLVGRDANDSPEIDPPGEAPHNQPESEGNSTPLDRDQAQTEDRQEEQS